MINQCTFNRKRLSIFWDYRYNLTRPCSPLQPAKSVPCWQLLVEGRWGRRRMRQRSLGSLSADRGYNLLLLCSRNQSDTYRCRICLIGDNSGY